MELNAELLRILTDRTGVSGSIEQATAMAGDGPWTQRLDRACEAVGLRVRWLVAPAADAAPLARPDLPVVGRSETGTWWVLDRWVPGFVRGMPVGDPRGERWYGVPALVERLGSDTGTWALVEPVLPAAPLSGARSPTQRLRALLAVERRDIAVVVMYGAVAGLLSLAIPLGIQVLINWLAFGALVQPILLLGVAVLVCLTLAATLAILQRIAVETVERRLFVRTVADLAARLARVRVAALDGVSGPELANRFFDVLTLQKAAGTLLLDGVTALLQVTVAVALLAVYHPWLLVFDLVLLAGMAAALVPLGRGAQATAIAESKAKYAVAEWIEEVARHPVALRQDGARLAETRADGLARAWLQTRAGHFRIFLRQLVGAQALQVVASAVLLVASGTLVLRGELTLGQLVAAEFIVTAALAGFAKFADKLDTVYDLLAGVDKLGTLLDLPAEEPGGLPDEATGPALVEVEGAGLTYAAGGGLPPIDLRLPPGSRTTVFGEPGTGKSTLAALVVGARPPSEGAVLRDGTDLRWLRPEARTRGAVLVRPGDVLVGSIRDNVALGRPSVGDPEVWRALEAVGLRRRIERAPSGLGTVLDPAGAPLTQAERRALLVARAIAAEPRLLVVDGLLDGLPREPRERLTRVLTRRDAPWTLLLLTGDRAVIGRSTRLHTLDAGGLTS